jgi:CheY-like chemotaxis protein
LISVFPKGVDDDAGFAAMGALYLESQGMRPIVVSSSMAALDVFETQAIDVVVTDIKLGPDEPHAPRSPKASKTRACSNCEPGRFRSS